MIGARQYRLLLWTLPVLTLAVGCIGIFVKNIAVSIPVCSILVLLGFLYVLFLLREDRRKAHKEALHTSDTALRMTSLQSKVAENEVLSEKLARCNEKLALTEAALVSMLDFAGDSVVDKDRTRNKLLKLSAANNWEDLHHSLRSSSVDEDMAKLFSYFDSQFLSIYPDFISRLNGLMGDGEHFALRPDGTMTSEMRVFALMRLGVTDSKRLASMLNIAVATVYNYRSRYKSKIAPNLSLEDAVASV